MGPCEWSLSLSHLHTPYIPLTPLSEGPGPQKKAVAMTEIAPGRSKGLLLGRDDKNCLWPFLSSKINIEDVGHVGLTERSGKRGMTRATTNRKMDLIFTSWEKLPMENSGRRTEY